MITKTCANLYLGNQTLDDTVKRYLESLEKAKTEIINIGTKMKATSTNDWNGAGREGFESELKTWLNEANKVIDEIYNHEIIINKILLSSTKLYQEEKSILEDMR